MTKFVPCTLESGFFESELYVSVGKSSAIVDRANLVVAVEPQVNSEGNGSVKVFVLKEQNDQVLIEIPGEPVVGSLRNWIPSTLTSEV